MWTHEESIDTQATAAQVWALLSDVAGWQQWNAGIERIALHGPFASGTRFSMKPPGEEEFTSLLLDVRQNEGFTDETVLDGTCVRVYHEIATQPSGATRITYRTEITGPAAADIGPMVTADFADVLRALKQRAEAAD